MIAISEIFGPTIQGEGALIGVPTVFVRTGGCDYRCAWCDTRYAVEPAFRSSWRNKTSAEILADVNQLCAGEPILITISGGNPALQPLAELLEMGHIQGHRFALETQGSTAQPWFSQLDYLTLSPKPPSSQMAFRQERFNACLAAAGSSTQVSLKLVIADEADYQWAKALAADYPQLDLYLQPCNLNPATPDQPQREANIEALNTQLRWLVERISQDLWYRPRILPQLHVLVWNNLRGV